MVLVNQGRLQICYPSHCVVQSMKIANLLSFTSYWSIKEDCKFTILHVVLVNQGGLKMCNPSHGVGDSRKMTNLFM